VANRVHPLAATKLDVPPERCVVVEDAPAGCLGRRTQATEQPHAAGALGRAADAARWQRVVLLVNRANQGDGESPDFTRAGPVTHLYEIC